MYNVMYQHLIDSWDIFRSKEFDFQLCNPLGVTKSSKKNFDQIKLGHILGLDDLVDAIVYSQYCVRVNLVNHIYLAKIRTER